MAIEFQQLTREQYFALEAEGEIRHEFIDGEMYPMTGGTNSHSGIIAYTIAALINLLLDSDCAVRSSDLRVRVDEMKYVYPDVTVFCGEPEFEDKSEVTLLNPTVVVEVTSPSSMTYDHVSKVEYYSSVPSIQGYLILDQERVFAEWYSRTESGWHLQQFNDLDSEISLEPLGCNLRLAQVYRGVKLTS